jgi:hypothetical protein
MTPLDKKAEHQIIGPAVTEILLPEISRNPRLEAEVKQRIQKRINKVFGRSLTEDEITGKYTPEVFEITMDVLEEMSDTLQQTSQKLLKMAIQTRNQLRLLLPELKLQRYNPQEQSAETVLQTGLIKKTLDNLLKLSEPNKDIWQWNKEQQNNLVFGLFETLSNQTGIPMELIMDDPQNRKNAAYELSQITGKPLKKSIKLFERTTPHARYPNGLNGFSPWQKWLKAEKRI